MLPLAPVPALTTASPATSTTFASGTRRWRRTAGDTGPTPGKRWGRYRIRAYLSAGGMGTVYEAYERALDRVVALKVPHLNTAVGADQSLRREAQAMARVIHPGVVPIHSLGKLDGWTYYTMELVRGETFKQRFSVRRPWHEIHHAFIEVAGALAAIHRAGLIHRDIKPSNLLLGIDGRARITDFGIALATTVDREVVERGAAGSATSGTPGYMAPEQFDGVVGDGRTDQFGFGVALFEALHGESPFEGALAPERLRSIAAGPRATIRPVPRALDDVARRALAADPARRYTDMTALIADLVRATP